MKTSVNTTVEVKLKEMAIKEGVVLNEALELGIKLLLADRFIIDYPEDCKIYQKMIKFKDLYSQALIELEELKNPKGQEEKEKQINDEMRGVFGDGEE